MAPRLRRHRRIGEIVTVDDADDRKLVLQWMGELNESLRDRDYERSAQLFHDDGYWRDSLSLAWTIDTARGPKQIAEMLARAVNDAPHIALDGPVTRGFLPTFGATLECHITWRNDRMAGRGYVRLVAATTPADNHTSWRAATVLTAANSLDGVEELSRTNRDEQHWSPFDRTWEQERADARAFEGRDPEVLIVGAGHAGLALAARLRHLQVDTLVVESKQRVGDTWRGRYRTLRLHNQIGGNHLPYLPFPASWPLYIQKDKLANWLEFYVEALELNVWTATHFETGAYDQDRGRWTVTLRLADGATRTLHPQHVVLATGLSGKPKRPSFANSEEFTGAILHSDEYDGRMDVAGKSVVVVGSGTSAHDIAEDVHARGGQPTMLQRSPTTVVSLAQSVRAYEMHVRNEGVRPIDDTDLMVASLPFTLVQRLHEGLNASMIEADAELHRRLREVDFLVDDSTSFFVKLLQQFGGYYVDVGASELIADGSIAVRSGVQVERLDGKGISLSDGTRVDADVVVLSTGYSSFTDFIAEFFGLEVAQRVGEVWGLDPSGELRNMWTSTAQPGLYIAGGPLTMCRFYSTALALRLKAALTGAVGGANAPELSALAR